MFNVLVAWNGLAWETDQFMAMSTNRFRLYSGDESKAVELDKSETLKALEEVDSLLVYETGSSGENANVVRVGRIYDIRVGTPDLRFRFAERGRLPRDVILEMGHLVGVDSRELNTTHWAVKDGSIPKLLLERVSQVFDVFLCYNSRDKDAVLELATALKSRGIRVWLDAWEIAPGRRWQDALESIIVTCRSAAVCVGNNGVGPWEDMEMKSLLSRFVKEKKSGVHVAVIPTLLPGAPDAVQLPTFLNEFNWANLRGGFTDANLDQLEWGITGTKPPGLP